MTYRLFYAPGAASLVVHWFLLELGQPVELILVDLKAPRPPELLAVSPTGRIPALEIDGEWKTECAALIMMLAERDPEQRFIPKGMSLARREYLQWMFFLSNTLQPAFRRWFYRHETAGSENSERVADLAQIEIERCFDQIDNHLELPGLILRVPS